MRKSVAWKIVILSKADQNMTLSRREKKSAMFLFSPFYYLSCYGSKKIFHKGLGKSSRYFPNENEALSWSFYTIFTLKFFINLTEKWKKNRKLVITTTISTWILGSLVKMINLKSMSKYKQTFFFFDEENDHLCWIRLKLVNNEGRKATISAIFYRYKT